MIRSRPAGKTPPNAGNHGGSGPVPRKRRPWRLSAVLALIALCLVWVYTVDLAHAAAIVAGAIVLGLCNEFAEGLTMPRLRAAQLKGLEQGATEQQFLAYSLTGDRPVGERAYRHFIRLAHGRLAKLGISLDSGDDGAGLDVGGGSRQPGHGDDGVADDAGNRPDPSSNRANSPRPRPSGLLRAVLTDPERGGRMTHVELSRCLDELDALERSSSPPSSSQRPQQHERRPAV